ncbi:adenylate/guanylate cyclase domain-containing protein [Noviherbaspirillum aridicola]|uniref:Adenylate/guanylate cyclase domain-containing protein n=1 Tax=Noviherbaspirillum aridicola TaxID=2849687 RepID=A0ABQ4Q6D7_9BURK|nr:adenylate/guanylate cyclase domain-containing protein [Noviherbaspirillum aridicola]GIZ52786.1 adenylate/guanylate cyclase domain-containing protein [Noviherbaspirillum aridicola]
MSAGREGDGRDGSAGRAERLSLRSLALGFVAIVVAAALFGASRAGTALDLVLLDFQNRMLAVHLPRVPDKPVAVVGIDEETVARLREPLALWHPHLGDFLKAMALARPAVVGLDVVLPDRSFDWLLPGYDRRLLEGLLAARGATRVVLGLTLDETGAARRIHPPFAAVAGAGAFGYVLLPLDADNIVRRLPAPRDEAGAPVASLAGRMATAMGVLPAAGGISYALAPPAAYVPLHQVLGWLERGDEAALRAAFEGRPVLLGSVLRFEDRHFQPVNLAPWEKENGLQVPGVMIQAQMVSTLINHAAVRPAPAAASFMLCLAAGLLWFLALRLPAAMAACLVAVAVMLAAATALLHAGWRLDLSAAIAAALLALPGRWVAESLLEIRERQRLRRAFAGYVSPRMMEEILAGRIAGEPGGELRTVCVMFADVRGFTTLSEATAPQTVMAVLNRYFEAMTRAIHAEDGTISCFMGDGIMAIFGAPKAMDDPSASAFAAARRMLAALPALNRELQAEGRPPLDIGIGLNLGDAIVGHVGSRERHDYSAIGDTINAASRLEGMSKDLGFPLICSAAVVRALGSPRSMADLGMQAVRGRSPMHVYGWRPEQDGAPAPAVAAAAQG